MKDRLLALSYLAAVLLITSWHQPGFLLACLALALLLAWRDAWRLARRALLAVIVFNSTVSLSYLALAWWQGRPFLDYLILLNLRVFLLTFLTFLLTARVNLFNALAWSKNLAFLLVLSASQVFLFRRLYQDFRLAWRSRAPGRPPWRAWEHWLGALGLFFLDKAMHRSQELTQAMQSRGFFNHELKLVASEGHRLPLPGRKRIGAGEYRSYGTSR
jgi:cobalt/nickel transport system permease protein